VIIFGYICRCSPLAVDFYSFGIRIGKSISKILYSKLCRELLVYLTFLIKLDVDFYSFGIRIGKSISKILYSKPCRELLIYYYFKAGEELS